MKNEELTKRYQLYWDHLIRLKFAIEYLDQFRVHAHYLIRNTTIFLSALTALIITGMTLISDLMICWAVIATVINVYYAISGLLPYQKRYYLSDAMIHSIEYIFCEAEKNWEELYCKPANDPSKVLSCYDTIRSMYNQVITPQFDSSLFPHNKMFEERATEKANDYFNSKYPTGG